jgi:hypothetical protein
LIIQDFEDLEQVMAHEVSHILVQDHGSAFKEQESISSITGWKPGSGIIHGGLGNHPIEKERKIKDDKTRCNYHICRKKTKLVRCKYCKNYYCAEHIKPHEPIMYNERTSFDKADWHPCVAYATSLDKKQKEANKKYGEALDNLLAREKSAFVKRRGIQPRERTKVEESEPFIQVMHEPRPHRTFSRSTFNFENFLRKYVYFRVPYWVNPYFAQFLLVFIIGLVLNYVYFQDVSIRYLFIDGLKTWFNILNQTLTYGLHNAYTLVYLIINGIYYTYFYYNFIMLISKTLKHLDKRDTWVMLGWLVLSIYLLLHFFPEIM